MPRLVALSLLAALGAGCLPTDTRPPPAEIEMTTSSSLGTRGVTNTVDGYQIGFEFVRASIGQPDLSDQDDNGGACSEYSNPEYTRLFNFVVLEKPEKVGLSYALGKCPFSFGVRFPNYDAVLGTGATAEDADYMRTPGSDDYAMDAGVSLWVSGLATTDGVVKSFKWEFRENMGYRDCWASGGDMEHPTFTLNSNEHLTLNVEIQAEALFRDQLDPTVGMFRFQPFADADTNGNGDGQISLSELDAVKLSDLAPLYDYPADPSVPLEERHYYCADSDGNEVSVKTLADYAYCALAPSVARFQGDGGCKISAGRRRRRD